MDEEAAESEATTLKRELEELEQEHVSLEESRAKVQTSKIHLQVATIHTACQYTIYVIGALKYQRAVLLAGLQGRLDALRQERYRLQGMISRASDRTDGWTNCLICGVAIRSVEAEEHSGRCMLDWVHSVAERTWQAIGADDEEHLDWIDQANVENGYDTRRRLSMPDHSQARAPVAASDYASKAPSSDKFVRVVDRWHHSTEGPQEHAEPQLLSASTRSPHLVHSEASRISELYMSPDDSSNDNLRTSYLHSFRAYKAQQRWQ